MPHYIHFDSISNINMNDNMDICETTSSSKDLCQYQDVRCALNEEPPNVRCISIESDLSIDLPISRHGTDDGYSDFFEDYDMYPTILGTGAYGCVRECLHRSTGEKYAVKTIEKAKTGSLDYIQREIQLLRSVDHPGIMKMVDCYEDENYVHIVTEKYTGGELFDKIIDNTTDSGCLLEDEAAKIIKSLLEAVHYLHSKDIVHRDIKPENVLFESNEEGSSVKLIDFGLSRIHCTTDGAMTHQVGTSYYMSPGVLKGKYDRSCDLWSIGVIAYILLCGCPPFNGSSDIEIHNAILRGDLVYEKDKWGNSSNTSRDFISKLLCMDSSKIDTCAEALQHPWIVAA